MFGITGGYHRYFSHKSYKTSRFFQFILAILGNLAFQKGPLWWAAHHRHHHIHSDTEQDIHSPIGIKNKFKAFFWSHMGWVFCQNYDVTPNHLITDFARYRELRWIDKYDFVFPSLYGALMFGLGHYLALMNPELGVTGLQFFVYGFLVSTVVLYHGVWTVNSLTHWFGKRRFETTDESRNNWFVSIITLGEGWHNNHHRYPRVEQQGFFWYEYDVTHYILKTLSLFGIVWSINKPPKQVYQNS